MTGNQHRTTTPPATPEPDEADRPARAAEVTCTKRYDADLRHRYAFMMTILATRQSFTVYAIDPDAYTVGAQYALTITAAGSR